MVSPSSPISDFPMWALGEAVPEERAALFRCHARTGRPLGSERFVTRKERLLGRVLRPRKRGPQGPWKHGRRPRN